MFVIDSIFGCELSWYYHFVVCYHKCLWMDPSLSICHFNVFVIFGNLFFVALIICQTVCVCVCVRLFSIFLDSTLEIRSKKTKAKTIIADRIMLLQTNCDKTFPNPIVSILNQNFPSIKTQKNKHEISNERDFKRITTTITGMKNILFLFVNYIWNLCVWTPNKCVNKTSIFAIFVRF